ncbi:MAG TPA: hypothetical protein VEC16_01315 [Alphaproteobacteria bacterium]|nr:hypothetical protein [Alphaproteobacteria bacterium]
MKMPKPKKKEVYDVPDVIVLDEKKKDDYDLGKDSMDNLGDDEDMDFDDFEFDDGGD